MGSPLKRIEQELKYELAILYSQNGLPCILHVGTIGMEGKPLFVDEYGKSKLDIKQKIQP